jgi:hypothetical protein
MHARMQKHTGQGHLPGRGYMHGLNSLAQLVAVMSVTSNLDM